LRCKISSLRSTCTRVTAGTSTKCPIQLRTPHNSSSSIKNLQRFHFSEDWNLLTPIRSDTNLNSFIYTKSTAFLSRIICFYSKVQKVRICTNFSENIRKNTHFQNHQLLHLCSCDLKTYKIFFTRSLKTECRNESEYPPCGRYNPGQIPGSTSTPKFGQTASNFLCSAIFDYHYI